MSPQALITASSAYQTIPEGAFEQVIVLLLVDWINHV